jgi:predicted DNA binding CopG/RHH family protein
MIKKISYSTEPLGKFEVIPDFLPSPAELALKDKNVKITIALSKESIDYFKQEAARHDIKYQRMIRNLLDLYVSWQKSLSKGTTSTK